MPRRSTVRCGADGFFRRPAPDRAAHASRRHRDRPRESARREPRPRAIARTPRSSWRGADANRRALSPTTTRAAALRFRTRSLGHPDLRRVDTALRASRTGSRSRCFAAPPRAGRDRQLAPAARGAAPRGDPRRRGFALRAACPLRAWPRPTTLLPRARCSGEPRGASCKRRVLARAPRRAAWPPAARLARHRASSAFRAPPRARPRATPTVDGLPSTPRPSPRDAARARRACVGFSSARGIERSAASIPRSPPGCSGVSAKRSRNACTVFSGAAPPASKRRPSSSKRRVRILGSAVARSSASSSARAGAIGRFGVSLRVAAMGATDDDAMACAARYSARAAGSHLDHLEQQGELGSGARQRYPVSGLTGRLGAPSRLGDHRCIVGERRGNLRREFDQRRLDRIFE